MKRLLLLLVAALALLVPAVARAGTSLPLTFNPSSHDFGTIDATANPATQAFTLSNPGTKGTGGLTISLSTDSSLAFSISNDRCTGKSLGPKKSCSVTVQYDPTSTRSFDLGTLNAVSAKPAASATASLTGASKSAAQVLCESYLGTFTGPFTANQKFRCVGWPASSFDDLSAKQDALGALCLSEFFGITWGTLIGNEPASPDSSYPTVDTTFFCINVG